jgi:hypothetical protein
MKPFKRTPVARITAALASLLVIGLSLVFLSGIANAWEPGSSDRRIPRPPGPDAGWWVVHAEPRHITGRLGTSARRGRRSSSR